MTETPEKADLRLSDILDAALRLFHDKGYDATSVQDVARSVGILKGSLYYYIDSKEDLLYGIVSRLLNLLIPNLEEWRSIEGTGLERICRFVEGYVLHVVNNQEQTAVMLRDLRALSEQHRNAVLDIQREYDAFLAELIEDGRRDGSVTVEGNTRIIVNSIYGMTTWTYRWYRREGSMSASEIAKQITVLTKNMLTK